MNSIETAKQLLLYIQNKQVSSFNQFTTIQFHSLPYQQSQLFTTKIQNLNQQSIIPQQYNYSNIIQQQKKLSNQFNQLLKMLQDLQQLFQNGLEDNCIVQGLIGIQTIGIYMIKEFEIMKQLQKQKPQQSKINKNKECEDLEKIYNEKIRIEIIQTLLFIKQKVFNEQIKHMKESIYNNDILIYDYGNIKRINQINQKLQIDGPIIQKQLQDRLINIKQLIKQKHELELKQKQQQIDQSQFQQLQQQFYTLKQLQQMDSRAKIVKQLVVNEYQNLNQALHKIKSIAFDYLHNTIIENKLIIEFEKQQTKPITYIDSNTKLGQLIPSQNVIDIEKLIKQIKTWCKSTKIIEFNDDCSDYHIIEQCLSKLRLTQKVEVKQLNQLRQLFIQIQKL